jgi:TM2 domain-containing membrane protein YozV
MAEAEAAPQRTPDQLFEDTVKGRYKLAEGTSSARFWAPTEDSQEFTRIVTDPDGTTRQVPDYKSPGAYVPRPDRNMSVLKFLSAFPLTGILGIDHFYLRSPGTGILKMLTFGGIGLWYVWDMLQVLLEKGRVLNYGMSTPFDMSTGIGQGMITDLGTKYTQETSFFAWTLATVFGFTGADMFATNQIARGTRILVLFILAVVPLVSFLSIFAESGFSAAVSQTGYIGTLVAIFWMMILGFGVFGMWGSHLHCLLFDPKNIMKKGMPNPEISVKIMRWYEGMFVDKDGNPDPDTKDEYDMLRQGFAFEQGGTKGADLAKKFWIGHDERAKIEGGQNESSIFSLYFIIFKQVFAIIWGWLRKWIFHPIYCMILPANCAMEEGLKRAAAAAETAAGGLAGGLLSAAAGAAGGLPGVAATRGVAGGLPGVAAARDLAGGLPGGLLSAAAGAAAPARGGAREESLSTEAKIIGASLAALISGGALKGLVDYLMTQ